MKPKDIEKLVNFSGELTDFYAAKKKICPQCGAEWGDFLQTFQLGCSKCYDTFHDDIVQKLRELNV